MKNLTGALGAEFLGTAMLVFFGDGVVATAVLFGAYQGQWQPSILWGLTVMGVCYTIGAVSGAHINPAVTLCQALFRKFGWMNAIYYWIAQLAGAFAGAALLHAVISPVLATKGMTEATARIFSCFPGANVTNWSALGWEIMLTMFLVLVILAIGDAATDGPKFGLGTVVVGAMVALLVGIGGPWTMASLNPARDLGPRLWMLVAGWGSIALPANGYWWVPIVGPLVGGGIVAPLLYDNVFHRFIPSVMDKGTKKAA